MSNINRVIISGRLTRDPEVRSTAGGTTVMGLGVAVNDRRRNQQTGQWEDYTNYIDCTMFGSRAESLSHILTKGMLVCIEGRLRWSQWERDGQKRSKIEVIVDEVEMPSRPQGGQDAGQSYGAAPSYGASQSYGQPQNYGYGSPAPSYGAPAPQPPMDQIYDEEIPF
jgi:single-strand DNA-binding protein